MAGRSGVKDTDRGMQRIVRELGRMDGARIEVGWFAGVRHPSGESVAGIAAIHEFGAPRANIPPRPTLGPTYDEKLSQGRRELRNLVLEQVVDRAGGVKEALERFGARRVAEIKRAITALQSPPLKPATIARKGASKPLIDTGAMRDAVDSRVRIGGR